MKRIFLFVLTNVAAVATLTVAAFLICAFCGVDVEAVFSDDGLGPLLAFSFVFGMAGSVISLLLSKTIVRVSMKLKTIDGSEGEAERWLVSTVEDLARRAGVKTPEVAIYPGEANAFATGPTRNSALVAVSTRIMEQMSREELRAVWVGGDDCVGVSVAELVAGDVVGALFFSKGDGAAFQEDLVSAAAIEADERLGE